MCFCGSTLFYADSRICLCNVCVLGYAQLANVQISKFAYLRIYSFLCGFANLRIRRLRYVPLAADSRICLCAVCVLGYAQLANVRISKFAFLRIYSFLCGFADLLMRRLRVRLCAIGKCANQQICISAYFISK